MDIEIPMHCGWVFIMYSYSGKLDKKKVYRKYIRQENGEHCKFQNTTQKALFNQRWCKFYNLDQKVVPKKIFFKVDSDKYFYTHATWRNHFVILVDRQADKQHVLLNTLSDLTDRVLFYFQSIYHKHARHLSNVTPHNYTLAQS